MTSFGFGCLWVWPRGVFHPDQQFCAAPRRSISHLFFLLLSKVQFSLLVWVLIPHLVMFCLAHPKYFLLDKIPHLFMHTASISGGSSSGSRGAPAPLDPKTPWSPPLALPSFWRRKDEEEGEKEERKEEINPLFKNFWIRHWFQANLPT